MSSFLTKRINANPRLKRLFESEYFKLSTTEMLWRLIVDKNINIRSIAIETKIGPRTLKKRLGDYSGSMTLNNLSDIAFCLGKRVKVSFEDLQEDRGAD